VQAQKDLQDANAKAFMLQQMLDDAKQKHADLETNHEKVYSEKVTLERAIKDAKRSSEQATPGYQQPSLDRDSKDLQTEALNETITSLKERIRLLEIKDPAAKKAADAAQMRRELDVLKRENKLIGSAWWDLAGRLQMNNVSLQRRSEAPRGWLRAQRDQVQGVTAVRGS